MPFDFSASPAIEAAPDCRRRPDGGLDYDDYRQVAREARAQAIGRATARVIQACGAALGGVVGAWLVCRDRARARHQLLAMDDRALRDIGISRCDAAQGVQRRLWRP